LPKKNFLLFLCGNCGSKLYSPRSQKTKKCIKCNKNINIERAKKIGSCVTEREAIDALKYLKLPKKIRDEAFKAIHEQIQEIPTKESKPKRFNRVLENLSKESKDGTISKEIILKEAELIDLDEEFVCKMLNELSNQGIIYEPKIGYYKLI